MWASQPKVTKGNVVSNVVNYLGSMQIEGVKTVLAGGRTRGFEVIRRVVCVLWGEGCDRERRPAALLSNRIALLSDFFGEGSWRGVGGVIRPRSFELLEFWCNA